MQHFMESPKLEQVGQWARTVMSKKENMVRSPSCKFNPLTRKSLKQPCLNRQLKSPKCYIKITGSRYNGTFLLNIDDALDDAIFHTMRDIEVALEEQADPMGKPKVCPKNCLSSVFRCFGTSDLQTKAVCNRKKPQKAINKPAECSLTATINKSDLGPLINAVQANSFTSSPEISSESVMRDVVDVFRTTLDQFRKENLNSFEEPPSQQLSEPSQQLSPKQPAPISISNNETFDRTNQPNEELKRVSFIKFSQEEVLVIQPPKPSNNDTKELEVGIEVKPKTTSSNFSQSIKLAKDKVLIGMQDGRGVLQINDGVPKRSLQMVIEEGVNGKPSMKLSLKEEDQNQKETPITEQNHTDGVNLRKNKEEFPKTYINSKYNGNESVSNITNNHENTVKNSIFHENVKNYKSVESQVSWAQIKDNDIYPCDKRKFISESTQYHDPSSVQPSNASHCVCCAVGTKPLTTVSDGSNHFCGVPTAFNFPCVKKDPDLPKQRESRNNRMPYLVHTLYEPRSLNNSSAYFASDKPSTYYGSMGKAPIPRKFEATKRQIRKPKSFSFSSDYSGSSKCTKIFRDIGEIRQKGSRPLGKKDASMTASLIEDFENILQNMCGSSYLYHHPQLPESKPSKGPKHHEQVLKTLKHSLDRMSFDQWTQTESCNQESTDGFEPTKKGHVQKDKTPKIRESGDGSHPKIFRKKDKRSKSIVSKRFAESSMSASTSGLEEGFSSDSSDSNKNKLVFSMFSASDGSQLARTSSLLINENWTNGKAKSFVGQKIFDAIEDHTNHPTLFGDLKKTDSFVYPACKDASKELLQGGNSVSVAVNMALYDGPTGPSLTDITEEDPTEVTIIEEPATMTSYSDVMNLELGEQSSPNSTLRTAASSKSSFPIRVKSKSCQNLLLTPTTSRTMENGENGITRKIKRLRYPQLTTTDSHHTSTLNVCGILNFNEGEMKANDNSLVKFETLNPRVEKALPSAVRSLLLPRQQSLIFNAHERTPTYCCNPVVTNPDDYWDWDTFNQHGNYWGTTDEAFDSVKTVAIHRGIFKRTFFAMKSVRTVVTRKFSSIFQKLSFAHTEKKKKNSAINDRAVYVAIPLKKKSENLHLYPRLQ